MTSDIDLSTLLGVMGGSFALVTTVFGLLVKLLLKSYAEKTNDKLNTLKAEYGARIEALGKDVSDVFQDRRDCESRSGGNMTRLQSLVDKLQDQWLAFQKEAAAMEATRGKRIDAMFSLLDKQKDEIAALRPMILEAIEKAGQKNG